MNLKDLTTEEAFKQGVISKGKWNDDESWELVEPLWKKVLTMQECFSDLYLNAETRERMIDENGTKLCVA